MSDNPDEPYVAPLDPLDPYPNIDLDELYSWGRHLYYEGDDPTAFISEMEEEFGPPDFTKDDPGFWVTVTFEVPPGKVAAFYEASDRRGWSWGS